MPLSPVYSACGSSSLFALTLDRLGLLLPYTESKHEYSVPSASITHDKVYNISCSEDFSLLCSSNTM